MDCNLAGTRQKTLTYADVVRTLNDKGVKADINDACAKLAQAMAAIMPKFDAIAKQLHTVDLLRRDPPLKPGWEALRKVCPSSQNPFSYDSHPTFAATIHNRKLQTYFGNIEIMRG